MSTESIDDLVKELRTENSNSSWQTYCDELAIRLTDLIKQSQLKARIDELNRYDTDEDMYKTLRTADLQNQVQAS
jgi:hypothetical protein